MRLWITFIARLCQKSGIKSGLLVYMTSNPDLIAK